MSDKEIILTSFKRIEQRIRANRLLAELNRGATLFLSIPLLLKVWDLFEPLRSVTISLVAVAWTSLVAAFVLWRIAKKAPPDQAVASVDSRAGLEDELKTAFWFINNPRPSEWVDAQIHRAARHAQSLNLDVLYPRRIPGTSWIPTGMVLLFVGLNFLPLSWNHNWLALQAAPAFTLSGQDAAIAKETKELLSRAANLHGSDLAQRLETIIRELQEGKIDAQQAAAMLEGIQRELEDGNFDAENTNEGLSQMAQALQRSDKLKPAADAMQNKRLDLASEDLQQLAENLDANSPEEAKEMRDALDQAGAKPGAELEDLAKLFDETAQNLEDDQQQSAQQSLDAAAQELESIQRKIDDRQLKDMVSQRIQSLKDSLTKRQPSGPRRPNTRDLDAEQLSDAESQSAEGPDSGSTQSGQQGQSGASVGGSSEGSGLMPGGNAQTDSVREGAPTTLKVKLTREKVTGVPEGGGIQQNIEETSKPERSKLDYQNVQRDLKSAQKDLLNQDRIPWTYRPLIKRYFQTIRPAAKNSGKE